MRQRLLPAVACLAVGLLGPASAAAQGNGAIGYSYVKYLEEGGGSAPLGGVLSLHGSNRTSLELDLGY
jgi:hypothetical protein